MHDIRVLLTCFLILLTSHVICGRPLVHTPVIVTQLQSRRILRGVLETTQVVASLSPDRTPVLCANYSVENTFQTYGALRVR